jgi:hypothetical protein
MISRADLNFSQGDDYAAEVLVRQQGNTPPNQILASYAAAAQIRTDVADNESTVACTIQTTIASPKILLVIPSDDTGALSGHYVWDLRLVDQDGLITTILAGDVNVRQEVTR